MHYIAVSFILFLLLILLIFITLLINCTLHFSQCQPDGFQKDNAASRYFHYGVREHAMAAISNGLFAHGGVRYNFYFFAKMLSFPFRLSTVL